MAVYTEITLDDAAAFFERIGLGSPVSIHGISGGVENTNYFVEVPGKTYVLTLFERLTLEQLPFYLHLMRHLAARGMPVPNPIATAAGEFLHVLRDQPAVVVEKLPGASVLAPDPSHCFALGEMLARMHLAAQGYPRWQANPRGLEWWLTVVPILRPHLNHEQDLLVASELQFQCEISQSEGFSGLPRGPVHADLFRDNVLFEGESITGIIDFYFSGCDTLLFDIATCLNDWCVDDISCREYCERTAALLKGYECIRALTPLERSFLPAVRRASAFRFWLSRLVDMHLPRNALALQPHDPSHFERMLHDLRSAHRAAGTVWP